MRRYASRFVAMLCACLATLPAAAAPSRWFAGERMSSQANAVLEELTHAARYGLTPSNYALPLSEQDLVLLRSSQADAALRDAFEAELSMALARFLSHLEFGQVTARDAGFLLPLPPLPSAMNAVDEVAAANDVTAAIALHKPRPLPYVLLERALSHYRELARLRPETRLPAIDHPIRAGDTYAGAQSLRGLLRDLGDLPVERTTSEASAAIVDPDLAEAIASFQRRHGLEADGTIGQRTFAALLVPLSHRVRQIELTMERWRWAGSLGRPDIVVNVPQFVLHLLPRPGDERHTALEMPIIVGQRLPAKQTPIFAADLKYVIFQPYWNVPNGIVRRELLPQIRRDPQYLERHHMELVDGQSDASPVVATSPAAIERLAAGQLRLRQRPGPDNALGPVKFMLPNPYNVYLHGTPSVQLFARSQRDFSHGCIRVSEPAVLAEFVLRNAREPWNADAIEAALCATQTQRVDLVTPLKVLIFYGTAAATQSSGVLFFPDIYGYDERLAKLLDTGLGFRKVVLSDSGRHTN